MVSSAQSILVTGPERCGNISLLAYFKGYNRGTIHHFHGGTIKPSFSNFYFREGGHTSKGNEVADSWIKHPWGLVIFIARDPIARVVSDVYHQIDQKEIPEPEDMSPSEYVMMMGNPDDPIFYMLYDFPKPAGADFRDMDITPPLVKRGQWFLRLRDFDMVPMIAENEGLTMGQHEMPHLNKSSRPEVKFPELYVNRLLDSAYTKFWFTDEEIEEMKEKWVQ